MEHTYPGLPSSGLLVASIDDCSGEDCVGDWRRLTGDGVEVFAEPRLPVDSRTFVEGGESFVLVVLFAVVVVVVDVAVG